MNENLRHIFQYSLPNCGLFQKMRSCERVQKESDKLGSRGFVFSALSLSAANFSLPWQEPVITAVTDRKSAPVIAGKALGRRKFMSHHRPRFLLLFCLKPRLERSSADHTSSPTLAELSATTLLNRRRSGTFTSEDSLKIKMQTVNQTRALVS